MKLANSRISSLVRYQSSTQPTSLQKREGGGGVELSSESLAFGSIYGYRYSQELHAGQGFQFHFRRSYIHTEREEVPQDLVDTPLEEISHRHSTYPLCHDITSFTTPTHDVHNTRSSCDRGWGTLASNLFLLLYSCSYIDDPCIESPYTFTTP